MGVRTMSTERVPLFKSFYRSQMGSFLASVTDLSSLYICTEFIGIYYVISAAIASSLGAIVGFIILRFWAFERTDKPWKKQAIKYAVTSAIILLANVAGIYVFTEFVGTQYMISKVIISLLVGFGISFPLFRYYVYS